MGLRGVWGEGEENQMLPGGGVAYESFFGSDKFVMSCVVFYECV